MQQVTTLNLAFTLTHVCRYKMVLVLGLFLVVVWAGTGRREPEEELETPPLPSRIPSLYSREEAEDREARHVKEEVARVLEQAKGANRDIREQLLLDNSLDRREKPVKDLRSRDRVEEVQKLVTRRKQNSLNGIDLPRDPPGKTSMNRQLTDDLVKVNCQNSFEAQLS